MVSDPEKVSSLQQWKESEKQSSSTLLNTPSSEAVTGSSVPSFWKKHHEDILSLWQAFTSTGHAIFRTPVALQIRSMTRSRKSWEKMIVFSWIHVSGVVMSESLTTRLGSWYLVVAVAWSCLITSLWPLVVLSEIWTKEKN